MLTKIGFFRQILVKNAIKFHEVRVLVFRLFRASGRMYGRTWRE